MRIVKDQDFKAAIIKNVSMSNLNTIETSEKNRNSQQRNTRYKEEPNKNFRTENIITKIKNTIKISISNLVE